MSVFEPDSHLHQKLSTILRLCEQMNAQRDVGALLDLVAREATLLMDADRASIFVLDREKRELWSKVALGNDEIIRFDANTGIAGVAALTGATVNVQDAYRDGRFNQAIDDLTGYKTRNLLAVPLQKSDGEIVGAFEVLNKRVGSFNSEDEFLLKALAAQAAIAIQNTQYIGRLTRSQDELERENAQLRREVEARGSTYRIVGNSARIQNVLRLIERIRDSSVNVLIGGESGTGKELIARAIHYSSLRARRPFVALNCAALPENLVESELFGIERGVATGVNQRHGLFQAADGGTLFLDEIGDLSLTAQAKILRVLQEKVVERVGGRTSIAIDVRVLSATNKDLEEEIRQGRFREDLLYRLKVIHIIMPSLREIREDIPLLANHFLNEYARETDKGSLRFSPEVMRRLAEAPWPGNIRQLQNEVKRLVVCSHAPVITEEDMMVGLPQFTQPAPVRPQAPVTLAAGAGASLPDPAPVRPQNGGKGQTLKSAIEDLERKMIEDTLSSTGNNQQRTARILGLSRQGLINKMKRYGLG